MAKKYYQAVVEQAGINSDCESLAPLVMNLGYIHSSIETAEMCMYECKDCDSGSQRIIRHNDGTEAGLYYRDSNDYVNCIHDQIERSWNDEDNRGNENGGYLFLDMDKSKRKII